MERAGMFHEQRGDRLAVAANVAFDGPVEDPLTRALAKSSSSFQDHSPEGVTRASSTRSMLSNPKRLGAKGIWRFTYQP